MAEPICLTSEEELVKYIRAFKKKHGISNTDIGEVLGTLNHPIDRTIVSKMLKDDFEEGEKSIRPISYAEAYQITKFLLERTSPFPSESIQTIYTPANRVKDEGTISSNDTIEKAALIMYKKDFSQLLVRKSETDECLGIVTDYSVFKEMLSPFEVSSDWLTTLKTKKIGQLFDRPPRFNANSKLIEVAQGLIHQYAVLIQEENDELGIITRWDFLRLIKKEEPEIIEDYSI
jgi:predicted transcriptional regulator